MHRRLLLVLAAFATTIAAVADKPSGSATPHGQRIFICGHSFHMPVGSMLPEVAQSAGITDRSSSASSG